MGSKFSRDGPVVPMFFSYLRASPCHNSFPTLLKNSRLSLFDASVPPGSGIDFKPLTPAFIPLYKPYPIALPGITVLLKFS